MSPSTTLQPRHYHLWKGVPDPETGELLAYERQEQTYASRSTAHYRKLKLHEPNHRTLRCDDQNCTLLQRKGFTGQPRPKADTAATTRTTGSPDPEGE